MTPMTTLQSNRRSAALRGDMWLRSRIGDAAVDAQDAARVEYYRALSRRAREARAILVAPEPIDSETLF